MKKIIATVLLLVLLSAVAFCTVGFAVGSERTNVAVKERVLYGDRSYAEGVTVQTKAHYDLHLLWNTSYTIGENPVIKTDYEFYYSAYVKNTEPHYFGVMLDANLKYGLDIRASDEKCVGLQKAYRELYQSLKPGESGTKMIRLQDYYEYYPVRITMSLPGVLWQGNDYDALYDDLSGQERSVWDAFNEFFRIPIPEDLPAFEISMSRYSGDGFSMGSSGHENDYYFHTKATHTDDRVYFSISNKLYGKEGASYVDTSLIPGGYGIYSFAYENVRGSADPSRAPFHSSYETGVDETSLATVYPLEQQEEVIYLTLSRDESKLLMFAEEYGTTYLTVIDIATMTALQKFKVTDAKYYTFYEYEDYIAMVGWDSVTVIEVQEDGTYRLAFDVSHMNEVNASDYQRGVAPAMDFDGKRLVIVDSAGDGDNVYSSLELCGFTVAVYDATGLVYYGEYESSLSAYADHYDHAFNCLPLQYQVSY